METSKWALPGWRIEQKFNNRVLIGNWSEERQQFRRGNWKPKSTHKADYNEYKNFSRDDNSRYCTQLKHEGLDQKFVFSHIGAYRNYSNNLISWYDQQFNGREREESNLPKVRTWDGHTLTWNPERSDYPLQGTPTRFGLLEKKKAKLAAAAKDAVQYQSTYTGSFKKLPQDSFVTRHFSTPRFLSSHLNPHNRINKDLSLRNVTICTAQEHPPNQLVLSN